MNDAPLDLLAELARFSGDPLGFAIFAFPWGEEGSELEDYQGLEEWQIGLLRDVRDGLLTPDEAILLATTSGHGVGKSAIVSILILWAISTFEDTRGVVTANTENQLKTKTWAELAKWYRMFIGREFFKLTATALFSADPEHERTWRIDMVPWSERNMEAFAGLHNKGKRILVIYDEASAIPDPIWETTEGALTDKNTQIIWAVFGNPTKNTGRFRECFPGGKFAHRWRYRTVDSRTVRITNKTQFDTWVSDYGEDSDFVRVRVRGVFPRAGSLQFIPSDAVDEACLREATSTPLDPAILGVDVARFGDDASVIYYRKGRDARSVPPVVLRNLDTMALAGRVAEMYFQLKPDGLFVDGGGVGGGVVDRLRQLGVPVVEVQFGGKADRAHSGDAGEDDGILYANKRAEMWGFLRSALKSGLAIPSKDDPIGAQLAAELIGPEYGFDKNNAIVLEKKEDMKKRGLSSPDIADALAITYAYPVFPSRAFDKKARDRMHTAEYEYDPYEKVS